MMNTVNTEFSSVEVWFADQASKALEIEQNVNLTLIIGLPTKKSFHRSGGIRGKLMENGWNK